MAPQNLLLPMKLDAFVFNGKVCDGGKGQAKIAPITQPNYTFLQFDSNLAQNDILEHVDLHNSSPASRNPRFMDIGKATVRQNRVGVYIHWSLPRPLRSGIAATDDGTSGQADLTVSKNSREPENPSNPTEPKGPNLDPSAPRYHAIPNRWLVIRSLDPAANTTVPQSPPGMKPVTAWIVESDRTANIDDLPETVDVEVDVAPFITSFVASGKTVADISVDEQAEVFIGACTEATAWDGRDERKPGETRVGLSAASSSNMLFIDYQYHCGNVLSMLDTFAYTAEDGSTEHLKAAVADYYVIGWHNDPAKDIMRKPAESKQTRGAWLNALRISINQSVPAADKDAIKDWLDQANPARTLCHGSMYEVVWKTDQAPERRPADELAEAMAKMPLAVGTTPMDAVLSYMSERSRTGDVEAAIHALQTLLRANDDGVDAQIAAADELQTYNYAHFDGGDHFYQPAQKGKDAGAAPPAADQRALRYTNNAQHLLDATRRRIKQLRWDMFAWWWKQITDVDKAHLLDSTQTRPISEVQEEIENLTTMTKRLESYIGQPKESVKRGVMEAFHQRSDPTLLIGGVEAGWPTDFNQTLCARLDDQIADNNDDDSLDSLPDEACVDRIPADVRDAGKRLVQEFFALKDKDKDKDKDKARPQDCVLPLYHDGKIPCNEVDDKTNPWRDRWNRSQPWFPLYVEWEAEYAHVDYSHWELRQRVARQGLASKVTYVLKDDIRANKRADATTAHTHKDLRYVSGRSLVLPQPAFSLRIHIERLFATVPRDLLNKLVKPEKQESILKNLDRLALLSLPLAGLTDHLTTRYQGSHVKPLVRQPGRAPVVLEDAKKAAKDPNVALDLIEQESDPTPYGSLPALVGQYVSGFKPVTHGQLRFTKINVIDKFGQVVHAIDPIPDQAAAVYPSVSESFAIDPVPGLGPGHENEPNVVDVSRSTLACTEYVQLSPAINQPARVNAHFVVRDKDDDDDESVSTERDYKDYRRNKRDDGNDNPEPRWRPATEFDKPIWGWVVVNHADRGLQFFLPDGTFYREVRSAGSDIRWLPFDKPPRPMRQDQLDALVDRLVGSRQYLNAFTDMITTALDSTVPVPSAYSQFLNSLVGRPLALANMGWSLELDRAPLTNQSTVREQRDAPVEWGLLRGHGRRQYEFAIKFGDAANNYDGLVGYFESLKKDDTEKVDRRLQTPKKRIEKDGNHLKLDKIYTYFHSKSEIGHGDDSRLRGSPLTMIENKTYPRLRAYWVDPSDHRPRGGSDDEAERIACGFERMRNDELHVFGAIFDPFAPIAGFTGILPMRRLQLPTWTWETALKRITTFFHAGPLLLTENVPDFSADHSLKPGTSGTDNTYDPGATLPGAQVSLPALRTADWAWLQPYDLASTTEPQAYMGLDIVADADERPRWTKGPMTAVEGYMQLKGPVERGG